MKKLTKDEVLAILKSVSPNEKWEDYSEDTLRLTLLELTIGNRLETSEMGQFIMYTDIFEKPA